jgi:hypothetical protein
MAIEIKGTKADGQEVTISVDENLSPKMQQTVIAGILSGLSNATIKQGTPGSFSMKELMASTPPTTSE